MMAEHHSWRLRKPTYVSFYVIMHMLAIMLMLHVIESYIIVVTINCHYSNVLTNT